MGVWVGGQLNRHESAGLSVRQPIRQSIKQLAPKNATSTLRRPRTLRRQSEQPDAQMASCTQAVISPTVTLALVRYDGMASSMHGNHNSNLNAWALQCMATSMHDNWCHRVLNAW